MDRDLTTDERLAEHRRAFQAGDFARAVSYVAEMERQEDQAAKLLRVYARCFANRGTFSVDGEHESYARQRFAKTMRRAERSGRAWGWTWLALTRGAWVPGAGWVPGLKLLDACFADRELGIAAVGVKVMLDTQNISSAWPEWKGASKRVRPEGLVPALRAWALEPAEDRACFVVATERDVSALRVRLASR
jgi:hypothetical protein